MALNDYKFRIKNILVALLDAGQTEKEIKEIFNETIEKAKTELLKEANN